MIISNLKLSNKFNSCSNIFTKISKSINESYYFVKFITAIFSFGAITFSSNALKTLASLVAENGFDFGCVKFPNKFFTWGMLGTAAASSLTDGLNLMLDNYKKPIWKPFVNNTKWVWNKAISCCCFTNSESDIRYVNMNNDDVAENGAVINNSSNDEREKLEQLAIVEG